MVCWSRCTISVAWVVTAQLCLFVPVNAQNIRFELPDGARIRAAVAQLPVAEQTAVKAAAANVFPVFVFIPGIMGSRLTKTLPDGKDKIIWGQLGGIFSKPDRDLAYSEGESVKAEVMEEYFAASTAFDVYGKAVDAIRYMDFTMGDNVRKFAYDWRQSNRKSARDLAAWLCKNKDEFAKRPVVFVAHSMGGLVLKSWLRSAYDTEGCAMGEKFSDWLAIKKIFFLGTPHYGAPKAVMAFADQYTLLIDNADNTVGRLLGNVDAATVSKSVNAYGATFPSAYELLPVVNTSACFKEPEWPSPIAVKQSDGTVHTDIDIFNDGMWNVLKWPRNLAADIDRDKFAKDRLPTLLQSARTFLCDLSRFHPDERFDVVRIYGANRSTICRVMINQPSSPGNPATVTPEMCNDDDQGDGTVPKWVASEDKVSSSDKLRMSAQSHMHLVGSPEFLTHLRNYKSELHREMQRRYASSVGNVDGLVKLYASIQSVVPSAGGLTEIDEVSRQISSRVVAQLGIAPNSIFALARSEGDPFARAEAYRVFADVYQADDLVTAWALNNAAHIYLSRKDFLAARTFGKLAIKNADEKSKTSAGSKGMANFLATAGATTAVAAEQLQDRDTANAFRKIADNPSGFRSFRDFWN